MEFAWLHIAVYVDCEDWSKTIDISLFQDDSGDDKNIYMYITDGDIYHVPNLASCRISEDRASNVVDSLSSYPMEHWWQYFRDGGCAGFAGGLYLSLCDSCP